MSQPLALCSMLILGRRGSFPLKAKVAVEPLNCLPGKAQHGFVFLFISVDPAAGLPASLLSVISHWRNFQEHFQMTQSSTLPSTICRPVRSQPDIFIYLAAELSQSCLPACLPPARPSPATASPLGLSARCRASSWRDAPKVLLL